MFRGEFGKCSQCSNQTLIVINKPYLCKKCNDARKRMKKLSKTLIVDPTPKSKPIKRSSIKKKFRKPTGEWDMFVNEVWNKTKEHNCEKCGCDLGDTPEAYMFSHIVSKGRNPSLRLDPDNIELLCLKDHQLYEFGTTEEIRAMNNSQRMKDYLEKHNYLRWFKLFGDE